MDPRRSFGNRGEALAETFLKGKGCRVIAKQVRTPYGEIDLVALDGDEVVFVEVKTRHDARFGYPEEAVTPTKIRHMSNAAEHILRERAWERRPFRLDVIAILWGDGTTPDIQHFSGIDAGF